MDRLMTAEALLRESLVQKSRSEYLAWETRVTQFLRVEEVVPPSPKISPKSSGADIVD